MREADRTEPRAARIAARTSVLALDAPHRFGSGMRLGAAASTVLLVAVVGVGAGFGSTAVWEVPALTSAALVATSMAAAVASFLLFAHATFSRERGMLALSGTYLGVALLTAAGALASIDAILGPASGPVPMAAWLDVAAHAALPLGIVVAAGFASRDSLRFRRPGPRSGVVLAVALSTALAAGVILAAALVGFPAEPAALWLVVVLVDAAALLGVMGSGLSRFSRLAAWSAAVCAIATASSVLHLTTPVPYSVAWFAALVLWVGAVLLLPMLMLRELGRVERHATRVAYEDQLTGLMSRQGLMALLRHELERAAALGVGGALIWLDLDDFTAVNDQFGHEGGDSALRQLGRRLRAAARPNDSVARVGSDEFALLVLDLANEADVDGVAERALAAMRDPVLIDGEPVLLTASLGVALFTAEVSAEELLHRADIARQVAKDERGDRRSRYVPGMELRAQDRARTRQSLAQALRERRFSLSYQPLVDLRSRTEVGAEALLRLDSTEGPVSAGDFIGVAEESGQIRQVGRLVVDLLAGDLGSGGAAFPRVSMNLSVPELADEATVDAICDGPLAPYLDRITVEVTEGLMLTDSPAAMDNLGRLRSNGVAIALDDFGSGFANLAALADLAPDVVKVDAGFVRRAARGDAASVAFLRAARAIGEATGATVLAEGIETSEELAVVRSVGIDYGQGHLLGEPRPAGAA